MTTIDAEALRALADAGYDEIVRLCRPTEHWRMSVPADPTRDSDLILADVCRAVPALLDALAEREGEVEHQRKILAKRLDIVRDLTAAHDGVVRDLMAIHRIAAEQRARADAAEAKVLAVEVLIERVEQYAQRPWDLMSNLPTFRSEPIDLADLVMVKVSALRDALAAPEPTVQAFHGDDE